MVLNDKTAAGDIIGRVLLIEDNYMCKSSIRKNIINIAKVAPTMDWCCFCFFKIPLTYV